MGAIETHLISKDTYYYQIGELCQKKKIYIYIYIYKYIYQIGEQFEG